MFIRDGWVVRSNRACATGSACVCDARRVRERTWHPTVSVNAFSYKKFYIDTAEKFSLEYRDAASVVDTVVTRT